MLVGMYDTAALKISILREDSASNQACANIVPNELVNIEWLYSFIDCAKNAYLSQRRGVRQKNLNLGMIKEFQLPLPPIALQRRFESIVYSIQTIKASQSLLMEQLLFDALCQRAFSGEL